MGRPFVTRDQAMDVMRGVRDALPVKDLRRFKSIHMTRRQNEAMFTIRCFFTAVSQDDPEDYVLNAEEL